MDNLLVKVAFSLTIAFIWMGGIPSIHAGPNEAHQRAPLKTLVIMVDNVLREIPVLSNQLIQGCPYQYKTAEKVYYFKTKDLMEKYQACIDLQKTACKDKKLVVNSFDEYLKNTKKYQSKLMSILKSLQNYKKKINKKISKLDPPNSLLKGDIDKTVEAHLQYFRKYGKKKMLIFFNRHYAKKDLGLVTIKRADFFGDLLFNGHTAPLKHRFVLSPLKKREFEKSFEAGEESKQLKKWYKLVFNRLPKANIEKFIRDFFYHQYVIIDNQFEEEAFQDPRVAKRLRNIFFPEDKRQRIEKIYLKAKRKAIETLNISMMTPSYLTSLKAEAKIQNTHLHWPPEPSAEGSWNLFFAATTNNAVYDEIKNKISIYKPLLNKNDWLIQWYLLHEIGHAIDPNRSKEWARIWKKLIKCFKRAPLNFKDHQIGEVFSDWFATEILMKSLEDSSLPNREKKEALFSMIGLCYRPDIDEGDDMKDPHPSDKKRINFIMRAHPTVRKILGCSSSPKYCGGSI